MRRAVSKGSHVRSILRGHLDAIQRSLVVIGGRIEFFKHVDGYLLLCDVDFFVFVCLFVECPSQRILSSSFRRALHLWEYNLNEVPDRLYDVVTEAWLFFGGVSVFSIAQEGYWHTACFLSITLCEELLEEQISPFLKRIEIARWC